MRKILHVIASAVGKLVRHEVQLSSGRSGTSIGALLLIARLRSPRLRHR
ncbi:hypothetical protein HNQ75_004201 [Rhizobium flavum]|uniref:Uncharacterized protein n=1 Tax=Pseudorhizobium flavum TaxID=1335061 RepID=A0A7W9Z1H8_9HYPH|nr:hypothetical protein [Pseudorhizobium flavum]